MEELTNWGEYVTLFAGLFAMINIVKNVSIFLNLTADFSAADAYKTAVSATVTTFVVLMTFTIFGNSILAFFRITINHVQIAGGIILLIYALAMVGAIKSGSHIDGGAASNPIAIGLSPLGVPMLAGPGAISTVIVYAQDHETPLHLVVVSVTILLVCIVLITFLRAAIVTGNFISPTIAILINRVMGLIVAAIAVNFLVTGLKAEFWPELALAAPGALT